MAFPPVGPILRVVAQVLGMALAAIAILGLTALLGALLVSWCGDVPVLSATAISVGALMSLATWMIVATFHVHKEHFTVPIEERHSFVECLRGQLEALGYEVSVSSNTCLVARPGFQSLLFGGGIQADLGEHSARIAGPKVYLEMLRRRLRIEHHFDKLQRSFLDHRKREGEKLLRRVQVCLQVSDKQWHDVYEKIIQSLTREGAEVHCYVNILAQSEHGLRDSIIELGLQDWLRRHDIKAEVHKETMSTHQETPIKPVGQPDVAMAAVAVVAPAPVP